MITTLEEARTVISMPVVVSILESSTSIDDFVEKYIMQMNEWKISKPIQLLIIYSLGRVQGSA